MLCSVCRPRIANARGKSLRSRTLDNMRETSRRRRQTSTCDLAVQATQAKAFPPHNMARSRRRRSITRGIIHGSRLVIVLSTMVLHD